MEEENQLNKQINRSSEAYLKLREKANARKQKFLEKRTPEQRENQKAKDREYHQRKRAQRKAKSINEMSETEKTQRRMQWQKYAQKYRAKKRMSKFLKKRPLGSEYESKDGGDKNETDLYVSRDSSTSSVDNEIKLLCPKCKTEVPHAAERIQEEQRKLLIAKVYHYLEQEYLELQKEFSTVDLTRLLRFRHRTALATGVSEWTVSQILKEEKARNEEEESHKKRRKTRKRPRQTHSSSEDDVSDPTDYVDDSDDQSHSDENNETAKQQEVETLVVKLEPEFHEEPEIFIGPTVVVKQEPKDDMIDEEPEIFIGPTVVVKQEPRHEMIEVPVETDPITTEIKAEPLDIADRERKEKKKERNREYQKAWRQRKKDLKKKVSKEEKEEKKRKRHRANQRAYYHRTKRLKENDENVEELFQKQLDDLQITNKTPEVTKRRGRKKTRRNDVTSAQQQSQGDISTTEASSSFPVTEELDESSLLGSTAVKVEEFEIHEEGFS